jgi:CheY-like chemotaxis protein
MSGQEALTFPDAALVANPETPQYKILVVDDIWDNRQLLMALMKQFDFDVQEADTGFNAFETWKTWRPHLIWLDIRMPGNMDGYDVVKNIRALETREAALSSQTERTPIIVVTAGVLEEDHAPALQAGCDDFLTKPYRATDVFALMEKHLGVRVEHPQPPSASAPEILLDPEMLTLLPEDLRQDLRNAIESINLQAMYPLIGLIRRHSPKIADHLETLTRNYRFDTLQALLDNGSIEGRDTQ